MDRVYVWNSRKMLRKIHIIEPGTQRTWCKVENGSRAPMIDSNTTVPRVRLVCAVCKHLEGKTAKKKKKRTAKVKKLSSKDNFLASREWAQVRYEALQASDGKCQCCGRSKHDGIILHVDHIHPRSKRPDLALTLSNLQVLCAQCNRGKGAWDETDWRDTLTEAFKATIN